MPPSAPGKMRRKKTTTKKPSLKFGASMGRLARQRLAANQTVAKSALDLLEDQGAFLIQKILAASREAQSEIFKTQTLNAAVIKAGMSLVLPEDACDRAAKAGERAVVKLMG